MDRHGRVSFQYLVGSDDEECKPHALLLIYPLSFVPTAGAPRQLHPGTVLPPFYYLKNSAQNRRGRTKVMGAVHEPFGAQAPS